MAHFQIKRSMLGFASCVLGLIIFLPTSSWAISFALDAGIFGSKYTGDIYFTGPISNLAFSPMQNVRYNDYGTSLLMTPTIVNASQIEFEILNMEVPLNNCGGNPTSCIVLLRFVIDLNNNYPSYYTLDWTGNGASRGRDCLPLSDCTAPPTLPMLPVSPVKFLPNELKPVPEPGTIALFATGLLALGGYRWYYRRREGTQVG